MGTDNREIRFNFGLTYYFDPDCNSFLVSRRGVKVVIPDDLNSRDNKKVLLTERITDPGWYRRYLTATYSSLLCLSFVFGLLPFSFLAFLFLPNPLLFFPLLGLGELPEELRSFVLANAEVTHHTLHLGYEHYTAGWYCVLHSKAIMFLHRPGASADSAKGTTCVHLF